MEQHSKILLLLRKKTVSQDWMRRLPKIISTIETLLFRRSSSLEEYLDTSTLKSRIKIITKDIFLIDARKRYCKNFKN